MEKPSTKTFALSEDILLNELDKRYFAYADKLEPRLRELALARRTFIGAGESKPIASLREVYSLTTCLPWLFNEAFPTVSKADLFDIAEAGTLLILALLLYDHYLDGQLSPHPSILILYQRLHTAALRKFHALFGERSRFWSLFDVYFCQYTTALYKETYDHWGQVTAYSPRTMWEIGSGKVALLKTVTTALALKAGAETDIPRLETTLDKFAAAMQLGDDIGDREDDYQHQRYTWPLTEAILIKQRPISSLSVEEIGQCLENSVILETMLKQVIKWLQQALDAVADLHCPQWVEFVKDGLVLSQSYQRALIAERLLKLLETIPREKS